MNGFLLTIALTCSMALGVCCSGDGSEVIKCVKCDPCDGRGPKAVKCSPEELLPFFHYRSCVKIVQNDTTTNLHGDVTVRKRCSTRLPSTDSSCIMNAFHNTPGVLECKYYCAHDGCNTATQIRAMIPRTLFMLFGIYLLLTSLT